MTHEADDDIWSAIDQFHLQTATHMLAKQPRKARQPGGCGGAASAEPGRDPSSWQMDAVNGCFEPAAGIGIQHGARLSEGSASGAKVCDGSAALISTKDDPKESLWGSYAGSRKRRARKQDLATNVMKAEDFEFLEMRIPLPLSAIDVSEKEDASRDGVACCSASGSYALDPDFWAPTVPEGGPSSCHPVRYRQAEKSAAVRKSVTQKIKDGLKHCPFTEEEEQDIYERVEEYVQNIKPDPSYCLNPSDPSYSTEEKENCMPALATAASAASAASPYPLYNHRFCHGKRRSYAARNCFFIFSSATYYGKLDFIQDTPIADGTKLIKPANKLVELVAQAINLSPDGLLQVQQVYQVLMKKYPYFRYMDRSSINSWRSSIRHALYQKWFKKVKFNSESINSKGCFWAINRQHTPKEWTLPGVQGFYNTVGTQSGDTMDYQGSADNEIDNATRTLQLHESLPTPTSTMSAGGGLTQQAATQPSNIYRSSQGVLSEPGRRSLPQIQDLPGVSEIVYMPIAGYHNSHWDQQQQQHTFDRTLWTASGQPLAMWSYPLASQSSQQQHLHHQQQHHHQQQLLPAESSNGSTYTSMQAGEGSSSSSSSSGLPSIAEYGYPAEEVPLFCPPPASSCPSYSDHWPVG